ncbi:MAG: hypothetical protein AMJ46_06005 [Latescibacteria bacterium DG_63]|nr:MAG: hypothetical protein AMJ46_06005 [Latescibacteria bacterium DG_63]
MTIEDRFERIAAYFPALCSLALLAAYLCNINSGPFEDDFGWITMATDAAQQGSLSVWTDAFGCFFFRPFNMGLLALSLKLGSWVVAHGVALAVHVLLSFAVGWLAGNLLPGFRSKWLMIAAGCAFFVHQAAPTTVLQLDTLSQSTSDFFSIAAVMAALLYASRGGRWLIVAAVAALLAMLGKEGGVSTPLAIAFTVALFAARENRLGKIGLAVVTQGAAALVYVLWRTNVRNLVPPPEEAMARYDFGAGLETLRHLGQFVFVEVVPWNSASLLWNERAHEWILGIALAVLIVAASGLGWRRLLASQQRSKTVLVWLMGIFIIWCTPFVFLSQVSEQEAYRLAGVTALGLALGLWAYLRPRQNRVAAVFLVVWCAWVGVGTVGSVQKSILLRHNSFVVENMLQTVKEELGDVSQVKELWVSVGPSTPPSERYSVVYVPEGALRWRALLGLRWYLKRPDLSIRFFLPGQRMPEISTNLDHTKRIRVDIVEGQAELLPAKLPE